MKVKFEDILKAQNLIQGFIKETPLRHSISYTEKMGFDVFLKLENFQRTGSFKIRGAANKLLSLSKSERKKGVIAASAGNHAQGVACVAKALKTRAIIVMPEKSPLIKIISTKRFGAEVILKGKNYDEAYEHSQVLLKKEGYTFIHPYQDEHIVAGQGIIGLEIYEKLKKVDAIFVAIGGGGLCSGVAIAAKHLNPKIKIIGVRPQNLKTIADGIAVKKPSPELQNNFISKLCEDVVTVNDEEIAEAIVLLMERNKTIAEGAGAASLAALLNKKYKKSITSAVAIISGGNIDLNLVERIIDRGLQVSGRLSRILIASPDVPGMMNKLTSFIAEVGANIINITHSRISDRIELNETLIEFTLETTGEAQVETIKDGFVKMGFRLL
ncbi:MAG: threonine ammonia-lyase [Oligoflexia bacterium]|nr:threonine ammonia-lyase [Oligoflexia bacterium]